jgi:hypothetical protein
MTGPRGGGVAWQINSKGRRWPVMDTWSLVIGAVVGVFSSIAAWLIVFRAFAPRLHWSNELTKRERVASESERFRYAMVLTNAGWFRTAVNLHVQVRARMPMPTPGELTVVNHIFDIPTDTPFVPLMRVRRRLPWRNSRGSLYAVVLRLRDIDARDRSALPVPADVKDRIRDGSVEIEELFDLGLSFRYYVWGYDSLTGAFTVQQSDRISSRDQIVSKPPESDALSAAPPTTTGPEAEPLADPGRSLGG